MMIVTSIYSVVDGIFVSNFAGTDAFAGMNLIWPAIALISSLGIMIGSGGSALVSKTFGEGDPARANRIFSMLIRLAIIVGSVLACVMFILMPKVVRMLGADEALMGHAITYGRIVISVMPLHMLQLAFHPFYMVAEKPRLGTAMSLICGCFNIVLDALLIIVFKMGLAGAAIATAISISVGGAYPLWFFYSRRNRTQLKFTPCHNDWRSIGKSLGNGMSEFVGNIALSVISICYNWQLMRLIGADGVSAYGIIMYLGFIFAAVFIGYNMGISQVISFNYGAGNKAELRSLLKKSLVLVGIAGIAMALLSVLFAGTVADVFVGKYAELHALTEHATRIYMASFLICGFNLFTSAWFTALNNGTVSAIAAFVRTLVFELAAVFILPYFFGVEGIWYSVDAAEILALFLSASLILAYRKRYLR